MTDKFPGWRYGPDGKSGVFESEADVPTGWVDHPSLVKGAAPTKSAPAKVAAAAGKPAPAAKAPAESAQATGVDSHGHPFDPALHAATQSKTQDGLWRMKVGVRRPGPAPGYPLDL